MSFMYHWMVILAFLFPVGTLAAFIVDEFTKPALTCEPFLILWQGGRAPWTLRVLQASNSAVLENLGTFKVTSFSWNVNLAAGTSILIQLQDSTGATAISKVLTIQSGATDCTLSTVATQQTTTRVTVTTPAATSTTSTQAATSTRVTSTEATVTTLFTASASKSSTSTTPANQSVPNQLSSSSSLVVVVPPTDTLVLSLTSILPSENSVTGISSASESGTGAYSTTSPKPLSTIKMPTPIGVILGTLIPGLLLVVFFCIFLFRRRRRSSSTAGVEELSFADNPNTPAWFMRPAYHTTSDPSVSPSARVVSDGIQSSGSYAYRTASRSSQPSLTPTPMNPSVVSSDSVSRASTFGPSPLIPFIPYPEFSDSDASSTIRWTQPSSASGDLEQRMGVFRLPSTRVEPSPPPPYD
ncbi:hypothetical protein C8R43DRAFT_1020887 [Mycena crocata]|nr:hypothetical protein C8R43DRAFT_1020887 [Mycena crocata]